MLAGLRATLTWIALVALAVISLCLSRLSLGGWAVPVALVIALGKASLIALFFMRLDRSSASLRLVALAALAMTALLVGLSAADAWTRTPITAPAAASP